MARVTRARGAVGGAMAALALSGASGTMTVSAEPAKSVDRPREAVETDGGRVRAAIGQRNFAGALAIVERLAAQPRRGALNMVGAADIRRLHAGLEADDRLMAALDRLSYEPEDPSEDIDELWLDWATRHLDADPPAASRAVRRLRNVYIAIGARLDARFAPLFGGERFDPRAHTLAQARAIIAYAQEKPIRSLDIAALNLNMAGRNEEALALADRVLAQLAGSGDPAHAAITDGMNLSRAFVLLTLGRQAEGVDAFRRAARVDATGGVLTNYRTPTYAQALIGTERPAEGLAILDRYRPDHDYDRARALATRVCALERLGRPGELQVVLAELRAVQAANRDALYNGLVCAGDEDGAAAVIIADLAGTERRGLALMRMSRWKMQPNATDGQRLQHDRDNRIRNRPDVRAAIARVGRTMDVNLVY